MSIIHPFPAGAAVPEPPALFPSPFASQPHPLAARAAAALQQRLQRAHPRLADQEGKMFGVLVVRGASGELGYLAAFSGMLDGRWHWPGFVPPVFDPARRAAFLDAGEAELMRLAEAIDQASAAPALLAARRALEDTRRRADEALDRLRRQRRRNRRRRADERQWLDARRDATRLARLAHQSQQEKRHYKAQKRAWEERLASCEAALACAGSEVEALKRRRQAMSRRLQQQVFDGYHLTNRKGERRPLVAFYPDGAVPGGAGDCAGPKLLHYAVTHGLQPLALAEFWWGRSPADGVRHHGQFYPACRGKCRPILPFMLRGIEVAPEPLPVLVEHGGGLDVVHRDEVLVVIDKPAGLLSVPGKTIDDSVQRRLEAMFSGQRPLLVHRLDMGTSGLLLASLDRRVHKALQRQFAGRQVDKRYQALLAGALEGEAGVVDLPLRPDLDDRPRQLVCPVHGKRAITRWRVVSRQEDVTRVVFQPKTGRTHQLRLHAAHPQGLAAPIIGDDLYGIRPASRMMLHAERLRFIHPLTGEPVVCSSPVPF